MKCSNTPIAEPTNPAAYAQRAVYRLMSGGGWYTSRQIAARAAVTDPNATIRTMKKNGYTFDEKVEYNSHKIRYKMWRLIMPDQQPKSEGQEESTAEPQPQPPAAGNECTQKMGTQRTQKMGTPAEENNTISYNKERTPAGAPNNNRGEVNNDV